MSTFLFIDIFASLLTYCGLLVQNVQDVMNDAYPKMINIERDQKHLWTYTSFLIEVIQAVSGIYYSLTITKLKFDSCLKLFDKTCYYCWEITPNSRTLSKCVLSTKYSIPYLVSLMTPYNEYNCHGFTTPFRRGGSCTGPMVVDKQLNRLSWYEIYNSFIVSSCINQKVPEQNELKTLKEWMEGSRKRTLQQRTKYT